MFCSQCGKKADPGEHFCTSCGVRLDGVDRREGAAVSGNLMPVVIIGSILLVVLVLVVALTGARSSSPKTVANTFFKALLKGDVSRVTSLTDPLALQNLGISSHEVEEVWKAFIEQLQNELEDYSAVDFVVGKETVDGEWAAVEVKIRTRRVGEEEWSEESDIIYLVKRKGNWYIDSGFLYEFGVF